MLREIILEAVIDAAAGVGHGVSIDLALAELIEIGVFQLHVVQTRLAVLLDHRPRVVVVGFALMSGHDIGLIAEPAGTVHERSGEAVAVSLALLQKDLCSLLCPVVRSGLIVRHGQVFEMIADIVERQRKPRLAGIQRIGIAVRQKLRDSRIQFLAAAGVPAVCTKSQMPVRTAGQKRTVWLHIIQRLSVVIQTCRRRQECIAVLTRLIIQRISAAVDAARKEEQAAVRLDIEKLSVQFRQTGAGKRLAVLIVNRQAVDFDNPVRDRHRVLGLCLLLNRRGII